MVIIRVMRIFSYLALLLLLAHAVPPAHAQGAAPDPTKDFVYLISFGRADDVKLLLARGANPNGFNEKGWPLIAVAAARRDKEALPIVQVLVDAGANVNSADAGLNYPIFSAIKNDNLEMVNYLLTKNVNFHLKNSAKLTPRQVAEREGNKPIASLLSEAERREEELYRQLRSPQHKAELLGWYAFFNCAIQYNNFYLLSKQDPAEQVEAGVKARIESNKMQLTKVMNDLYTLFQIQAGQLKPVANDTKKRINEQLNGMISNRNRRKLGVGTDGDLEKRCGKIADSWIKEHTAKKAQ